MDISTEMVHHARLGGREEFEEMKGRRRKGWRGREGGREGGSERKWKGEEARGSRGECMCGENVTFMR